MTLRSATNQDIPQIRELVFTVLAEYGLAGDPEGTDADLHDLAASYLAPGGLFDVLEENGSIIGTVGLLPRGEGIVELRKMYLQSGCRGQGLGRRLLEHALSEARTRGFRRVELETASCLKEALALYQRYGFQPFESPHLASRCDQALALDLAPDN